MPGAAPSAPDPLAEIVRTSRTSTECLRRLREVLASRPLDEQAEELAAAMDSYAARRAPSGASPDGEAPSSPEGSASAAPAAGSAPASKDASTTEPNDSHTPEERKRIEEYQNAADPKAAEYWTRIQQMTGDEISKTPPFAFAKECPSSLAEESDKGDRH